METDNRRPNAALINREWFDAASSVLSADQLGIVLVNACRYVFGLDTLAGMTTVQGAVMAMIKPALDSDITRYLERCARNAANAKSQWQRVAASGTQSQPVAANTTTTTTTTPTTTPISLRETDPEKEIEIEKWLIFGQFWKTGSKAIKEELRAFWSYYEALGWKNNKGAEIVSKVAAARMWRPQYETGAAPDGAAAWFEAVKKCPTPDYNIWLCYAGAERTDTGAVVRLRCKATFLESLREVLPALEKSLQSLWKVPAVTFETAG